MEYGSLVPRVVASVDTHLCAIVTDIDSRIYQFEGAGVGVVKIGLVFEYVSPANTEPVVHTAKEISTQFRVSHDAVTVYLRSTFLIKTDNTVIANKSIIAPAV